jgi:hypothetical protein
VSGKLRASVTLPPANRPQYHSEMKLCDICSLFVLKALTLSSNEISKMCRINCYTKTKINSGTYLQRIYVSVISVEETSE